jgi:hypothetical protein
MTEEDELIEEEMIVEFRREEDKWIPLRVRYDKTAELRTTGKNFGNAYSAANSNWFSIHHPITDDMISTGAEIPETLDDYIYYNSNEKRGERSETQTIGLRNFHNWCKSLLFDAVSGAGAGAGTARPTLIDYAVGRGGDIQKWKNANLSFVFGVDVHKDNIENPVSGVCARYLDMQKTNRRLFKGMFVSGNSTLNLRTGEALISDKDKQITRAVFGMGEKNAEKLGRGVYDVFGLGAEGFQISSCQFAIHYFFETPKTLHNFLVNVSECTKVGGFFIGTCFDGDEVFRLLRNYSKEAGETIFSDRGAKLCEIIKMYDFASFPDDELSIGYAINVYQESINKVLREYLVKFSYLVRLMELYGFVLHAENKKIRGGSELFKSMFPRAVAATNGKIFMTNAEKRISFLNRCFVFYKTHDVDAKKLAKTILRQSKQDLEDLDEAAAAVSAAAPPAVAAAQQQQRIRLRKGVKVLIAHEKYSPIVETPQNSPEAAPPVAAAAAAAHPPKKKIIINKKPKIIIAPPDAAAPPPAAAPAAVAAAAPKKKNNNK